MDSVAGGPADDDEAGALFSDGRGLESLNGWRPSLVRLHKESDDSHCISYLDQLAG